MEKVLLGERIILKKMEESDAKTLLKYLKEPKINHFIEFPKTLKELEEYIELPKKKEMKWTILDKETNMIIGAVVLQQISIKHHRTNIGYRIGQDFEGKGYMKESLRIVIKYLFEKENMQRIQARIMESNKGSIILIEKVGFICEGKARNFAEKNGRPHNFFLYGLIKSDFYK